MASTSTDQRLSAAKGAAGTAAGAVTNAARAVLRAIVAIPMMIGRLGVVAGKSGVHLGTVVAAFSNLLSDGSSKARVAMEKAKAIDVHDYSFEAPRVVTKQARRKERGRRFGLFALVAGIAGGLGAGIAFATKRRREQELQVEEDLWTAATTEVHRPGVGDDEVIDVTAADR